MENLFLGISKYIFIILIAFFTLFSFLGLSSKRESKSVKGSVVMQSLFMYVFHIFAGTVLFLNSGDIYIIPFYGVQLVFFLMTKGLFSVFYEDKYDKVLVNDMCMLLDIGFMMLTRLDYSKAMKQFLIVCIAMVGGLVIPVIIRKYKRLPNLTYAYCFSGLFFLATVLVIGGITRGAQLSITVKDITFQPSEFVKILYVFFLAAFLNKSRDFKHIFISALFAGFHVIILVLSKDLGSALIFFIVYVVMIFTATNNFFYFGAGIGGGALAAIMGYMLFDHVRTRVQVFLDPWSDINGAGYQVAQSLFAIGTGGWLGLGLYKGMPSSIPLVDKDFMFSAIVEEMGGFFGIILIVLCLACFMSFVNISMRQRNLFYKLTAIGLATTYAVQTVLTIGGAIKFIPSTGVTLPLVSYGGSSCLCTVIMFSVLIGLSLKASDDEDEEVIRYGE